MTYARETSVSPEQTRMEIERMLARYGAGGFAYATELNRAALQFKLGARYVRLAVPLPTLGEFSQVLDRYGVPLRTRTVTQQRNAADQAIRARWRAVKLIMQAKLEAIEAGISTVEREFMPDIVLPDGRTLGEHVAPAIEAAYATGRVPALLPAYAPAMLEGPDGD